MTLEPELSGVQLSLLAWEASFLPDPAAWGGPPTCAVADPQVVRWPRAQRLAVAVQLLAAATFLLERGFYPSRRLLRRARVARSREGIALRLDDLPRQRLDAAELERRLRRGLPAGQSVLVGTLWPQLMRLLPERREALETLARTEPAWELARGCLEILLAGNREAALGHPEGTGRALWACRMTPLAAGVWWAEDEALARRAAAILSRSSRDLAVAVGEMDEDDVIRFQARAAADGRDAVVLTLLPLPSARVWGLDGGANAVWVLAPRWQLGQAHAEAALQTSGRRFALARELLAAGAARAFAAEPAPPVELPGRAALASPFARRVLLWVASSPAGLVEDDLDRLVGPCGSAVAELERLGLTVRRNGRLQAAGPPRSTDVGRLEQLALGLPEESGAHVLARALTGHGEAPAVGWCEARLDRGAFGEVLEVAGPAASIPSLALAAAEAALRGGKLTRAEQLLDTIGPQGRNARWQVLRAWWAEAAGLPNEAVAALDAPATGALPGRLVARGLLVRAALARRKGDRAAARRALVQAVERSAGPDAELELAALDGPSALRRLRVARRGLWSGDVLARYLHLRGLAAHERGCYPAAATAYRAALRVLRADNQELVGEIHLDLGCAAILLERERTADRHLQLAERLLERCGSRLALTIARHNRAVLACDRLDWRAAEALITGAREARGRVEDAAHWLGELELARCALARGDTAVVAVTLPALAAMVAERLPDHPVALESLARLRVNLALAAGDLATAAAAAPGCEDERTAVDALVAAARGDAPPGRTPERWGLALSAQLVRAWKSGDDEEARARLAAELERAPLSAAVGAVRALTVGAEVGVGPEPIWGELWGRVEAALATGALSGWARQLHRLRGVDAAALVAALDGVVAGGTDVAAPARLVAVVHALGLPWLAVRDGDELLAMVGAPEGQAEEVAEGAVRVGSRAPLSRTEHATLRLIARQVSLQRSRPERAGAPSEGGLLGVSPAMQQVREEISRWAALPVTVLILGEPGTGKELCARELHRQSGRRGGFVPVNCAGMPSTLLEAELFGAARGAYTGADRDRPGLVEEAEGGTLFLDEVGELPLELQGKLLRLLQEREVRRVGATRTRTVDVRFVAATNRDLEQAVEGGAFRRDLYYRLTVGVIRMPALRERPDDVEELARYFVHRCATAFGRLGVRLAPATYAVLRTGGWPGNVRELESAVARAVAAARPGEVLGPDRFPGFAASSPPTVAALRPWSEASDAFAREYFVRMLEACGGNRSAAARRAGISRQTLLYHLRQLAVR